MEGDDKMAEIMSNFKNQFEDVKNRAQETATGLMEKARETATAAGERTQSAVGAVGCSMSSLAGTIREKMPHEGALGNTSEKVASTLESGGRYLQEEGIGGMVDEMANLIRRNPFPALLVGIGIGFLLARTIRR
jgi:ElaB/YqjD/DUF883 family membrane-anchored ribosome-binding protein